MQWSGIWGVPCCGVKGGRRLWVVYGVVVCMEVLQAVRRQNARRRGHAGFARSGGTRGGGNGARGAAAFADAAGGAGLAAAFFVRQNRPQRFLPQCKRRSRRPLRRGCNAERRCYKRLNGRKNCIGKGFRSSIHCRKTECGAAILVAEQIWNGYPLLRNGIGRAALLRYKPAWRRRNKPARRSAGRTGAEAGGMNRHGG